MSLGLKRGTVQLEPHDKQWDDAAIQTIKKLKSILGDDAVDIQHIGSTAIPAIKAKPIIDIVVGVTDFDKVMLHNEQLRQVGIFYRGSDVERQLLYVMGDMENDTRTHHIHIVKWNGTEWKISISVCYSIICILTFQFFLYLLILQSHILIII